MAHYRQAASKIERVVRSVMWERGEAVVDMVSSISEITPESRAHGLAIRASETL